VIPEESTIVPSTIGTAPRSPAQPSSARSRIEKRVSAARLRLQGPRQAPPNVGEAKRREHRGGIGGGDNRSKEHRLQPRQIKQGISRQAGQYGRDDDPDRGKQCCRNGDLTQAPPRRREPALEQDRSKRDHTHLPRQVGIVEGNPARALRSEQHPEAEEDDKRRNAGARGAERNDDARRQHAADDQKD
jgi:hypothetical protein